MTNANITPHIGCRAREDFAKTVLMPGDPATRQVHCRNVSGRPRTRQRRPRRAGIHRAFTKANASPSWPAEWACPSMGIYSYELYNIFGVETIIRAIGSAGGIHPEPSNSSTSSSVRARATDSNYFSQYVRPFDGSYAPIADYATPPPRGRRV